jgi:hypothetical protein
MDSDEMLGAYALAGLSLNMGMANLLAEKGVLTEGEVAGLLSFAKEAIRQVAASTSPEVTADALGTLDQMATAWRDREKKH